MAMPFGNADLDDVVERGIRIPIMKKLGFEVWDMRDVARPGLIDSEIRGRIRNAAFVIADLTHHNPGAYWEAGLAEGYGKPVLYTCEKDVFEGQGTHFDTNHCTTVRWSKDNLEGFSRELVATLQMAVGRVREKNRQIELVQAMLLDKYRRYSEVME